MSTPAEEGIAIKGQVEERGRAGLGRLRASWKREVRQHLESERSSVVGCHLLRTRAISSCFVVNQIKDAANDQAMDQAVSVDGLPKAMPAISMASASP